MGHLNDKDIRALFDSRDERAITKLDIKYGRYCRTVAMRVLNNESDSEECVNDAYLKVWNSIPPAVPEKLEKYLAVIVRNTAVNRLRSGNALKRRPEEGTVSADIIAPVPSLSPTRGPTRLDLGKEERGQ